MLYVSVRIRFGATEATGKVAKPEYFALPGSGSFNDVAVVDAVGRMTLVAVNAASAGSTGEFGVTGDEVGAEVATGCGVRTLDPPQPAIKNVALIIARAR